MPGNTKPGSEDVNGGCTSNYKDTGSRQHADSSLKRPESSKKTMPGNTKPGSEDVNGGCASNYKGTSSYFADGLLLTYVTWTALQVLLGV
ncbi:hypothetical protein F3Y22_tig00110864pilonHSYRG00175 [Hibiscus syriacus]|uniref:Uncharacterized protein n=1 Tax=Hibiscus syriacus TaxID=106335 RepID=A0A6A2ZLZ7_HIBSY|nr:hypothetical protein F3Y22_tig00110864pilonHSYRG00175 [Hibiscus syriacus]